MKKITKRISDSYFSMLMVVTVILAGVLVFIGVIIAWRGEDKLVHPKIICLDGFEYYAARHARSGELHIAPKFDADGKPSRCVESKP